MWYLTSENDSRVIYVLTEKDVIIGRSLEAQNCNFAIIDDPSISRKHVTLFLSGDDLILRDMGSKYGTFLNNNLEKIQSDIDHKLKVDDFVKFGKMQSLWKVKQSKIITCTSTLKGENLQSLKTVLNKMRGILKSDWDETCQYLTMPAITLTIKVVLALAQGSYIVTVDYWSKCIESIDKNQPLPNPCSFVPKIVESTLNKEKVSFLPDDSRQLLFKDKKFIFFSRKQLDMYKQVLIKSSATPLLLSESKLSKSALCEEDVIVIQYNITGPQESQAQRDQINEIVNYLKTKGKRIIADAEVGLAVLFCSINKYCNPNFNFKSEVIKQSTEVEGKAKVLAQESQEPTQKLSAKENIIINESLPSKSDSNNVSINCAKRKLSEEDAISSSINKKIASGNSLNLNSNDRKRVAEEDLSNSSKKKATENLDDDEMFNFIAPTSNSKDTNKKLNLTKPSKRKFDGENNIDDDMFDFVGKKKHCAEKQVDCTEEQLPPKKVITYNDNVDVKALRGSKLQELMIENANIVNSKIIKKEDTTELDEKFSKIDLGCPVITIRTDLIVKKEALNIKSFDDGLKNFKKFKKVWPLKMQVSVMQ